MDRIVIFLILSSTLLVGPVSAQSTSISLTDVRTAYESLEGLQASFTQVMGSAFANDSSRIEGSVLLAGDKYRVTTPNQTVVTDGRTTWIYTPADSQVVINDADSEQAAVTPETFLTASAERYEVQESSTTSRLGSPHLKLSVTASDSSARFESATLWVRRSDRIVTRMQATDRNGSTLDLRLQDIRPNPNTLRQDAAFTFSPPDGAEVIDLREKS